MPYGKIPEPPKARLNLYNPVDPAKTGSLFTPFQEQADVRIITFHFHIHSSIRFIPYKSPDPVCICHLHRRIAEAHSLDSPADRNIEVFHHKVGNTKIKF